MEIVIKIEQIFSETLFNDPSFKEYFPFANEHNISIGFIVSNNVEKSDLITFHSMVFNDLRYIISRVFKIDIKTIEIAYDLNSGFAMALYGISINENPELIASVVK